MKYIEKIIICLLLVSFVQACSKGTTTSGSAEADDTQRGQGQTLAFGGQWNSLESFFAGLTVTKLQNVSGKPIKAFRAVLYRVNDFGEVKSSEEIEFTSSSAYGRARPWAYGHVIQPKEVIYWHSGFTTEGAQSYYSGINEIFEKVGHDQKVLDTNALNPKTFRLEVKQTVFNN